MAQLISLPTRYGNLTLDLDQSLTFKNQVFATYDEALAEVATLNPRCSPTLRPTDTGGWAILIEYQEDGLDRIRQESLAADRDGSRRGHWGTRRGLY